MLGVIINRFHGVVGYHVRLTRERSPVRTRMKPLDFECSHGMLCFCGAETAYLLQTVLVSLSPSY